jgi:glycosyltransferase involved in cell wall biosynthesis
MRQQRVYFFNRFFWPDNSATAQILTDLCRGLDDQRFAVTVVTSRLNYGDSSIEYPAIEDLNGVTVLRLWSTRFGRASLAGRLMDYITIYLSFFLFLLRQPVAGDICVFKTDPPLLSLPGAVAKSICGFDMISWCQDIFPEVAISEIQLPVGSRWIFQLLAGARNWSLQSSEAVVVLGRDMAKFLEARGVSKTKLWTISNWSVQEEQKATGEHGLRKAWDIPEGTFVVGYSGNLGRAHDWKTMFAAAELLKDENGLLFLCCGGGYGYEQLQSAVHRSGLEGIFRFLPYQPLKDLSSSLRVPDVHWLTLKSSLSPFIFPSKFFGILQAGRAMIFIGSKSGEIAELIELNRIGFVTGEGEGEALAPSIQEMKADIEATRKSGQHARTLWETHYQKSVEIEKWHRMLGLLGAVMEGDSDER